jgi:hypothetical protein
MTLRFSYDFFDTYVAQYRRAFALSNATGVMCRCLHAPLLLPEHVFPCVALLFFGPLLFV